MERRMRSAFKRYKLLKIAVGEEKMPEEGEARERWIEKSAVLFDLILQSVNKEMFEHIKDLVEADDSGPRAWKLLRDVIQPNTLPMVILLEKELAAISMRPGDDVKPVLDKIKDTYARMAAAGSSVSQLQQCTKIISVLDNSWDNLIPTLNSQQDQWTPEWLRQQILQEDFRRRHVGGGAATKTAEAATAAAAKATAGGDATTPTDGVLEAVKKVQQQQTHGEVLAGVDASAAWAKASSRSGEADWEAWHERLCHVNFPMLQKLRECGYKVKVIRSDNGGEFIGADFEGELKRKGIQHQLTVPYNPQQNGVAERFNRTLQEGHALSLGEWKQQQQKLPSTPLIVEADEVQRPPRQVEVAVSEEEMSGVTEEGGAAEVEQQQQQHESPPRVPHPPERPRRDVRPPVRLTYGGRGKPNVVQAGSVVEQIEEDEIAHCYWAPIPEPKTREEALNGPNGEKWKASEDEEFGSLIENETWDLCDLPPGKKAITSKMIYRHNYGLEGELTRYKSRLVAKGFQQTKGKDYDEVFAPVGKGTTLRVLLAMAALLGWKIRQMDIVTAFLNGIILEEVYMKQPEGLDDGSGRVCRLKKAIYGLKQAPRAWYHKFEEALVAGGFKKMGLEYSGVRQRLQRGAADVKSGEMLLSCYTDASFNSVKADGTSIGGYVCLLGGSAVSWRSKKQNEVGLSSCETEYMALHHGAMEVVWLRRLLEELGVGQEKPTVVFCDNESAVLLAKNACLHGLTKHIRPKWHWVRRLLDKEVRLEIVKTHQQAADIFTKRLAEADHWKGMNLAGMSVH
ncbi:hypothetical protein CLOM_g23504 [Closterium sp. NIES-68]|nr:hypothetical protein CLOM_g23504 [Closterium sp. NIES-68]